MQSVALIGKKNYFSASHTILSLRAHGSNEFHFSSCYIQSHASILVSH